MELEERVLLAQQDNSLRDGLISDNNGFILSCAGKALGMHIDTDNDAYMIAIIAFNDAITKYDDKKGVFLNFAALIIKNRMTDYLRKEYRQKNTVPFSSLASKGNDGEDIEFEIEDKRSEFSETALEIYSIKQELAHYGISFFDLPESCPKSKKTKKACFSIIRYILNNQQAKESIIEKKIVPAKLITEALKINDKILERYRKYIITAVISLNGDYTIIPEYFSEVKGGDML